MKSKTLLVLTAAALVAVFVSACSAIASHHRALFDHEPISVAKDEADPISGEWNVSFFVHDTATPATFTLKLNGTKVTGTAYSDHTGLGTVRDGSWVNNKWSFTLDFKKHESIAITGTLQDGKLVGEFRTEGFVSKWEAKKK